MGFEGALVAQLGQAPGNYVVSPASVLLGLAMAREGARGDSAAAFDAVLGADARERAKRLLAKLPEPRDERRERAKQLLAKFPRTPDVRDDVVISIANRLFGDRELDVIRAFVDTTARDYGAPFELVDFAHAPDDARRHINAWVARATRDRIRELLGPNDITALTLLVLVDAIYLRALWQTPFASTHPAPFAIAGGATVDVPTMTTIAAARWGEHAGASLVALPYQASELQMLIAVPAKRSLAELEAAYVHDGFAALRAGVRKSGKAMVALPKFQARTSIDLKQALCAIGLAHPFGDASDFSGIAASPPLQISGVIHQAWLAVDEAGTEAAAATAVVMVPRGGSPRVDAHVQIDRSFLFFVHDADDNVLFAGRVIDPRS
jgi:serpin B